MTVRRTAAGTRLHRRRPGKRGDGGGLVPIETTCGRIVWRGHHQNLRDSGGSRTDNDAASQGSCLSQQQQEGGALSNGSARPVENRGSGHNVRRPRCNPPTFGILDPGQRNRSAARVGLWNAQRPVLTASRSGPLTATDHRTEHAPGIRHTCSRTDREDVLECRGASVVSSRLRSQPWWPRSRNSRCLTRATIVTHESVPSELRPGPFNYSAT